MRELRYHLLIEVRSESLEYHGRLTIASPELPEPLTLDSVGHRIQGAKAGDRPLTAQRPPDHPGVLVLSGAPRGTTTVELEFSGTIDHGGLRGFYLSPLGQGRLYTTYLEPAGARRVLPCIDSPDAKAVFEVEVVAPRGLTVISNTAVSEEGPADDGRRRVRFQPTPPMSTYLLYLGIGPFEEIRGSRRAPEVILAAAPGEAGKGRFAVEQAERAVEYFSNYYSEPYPLPKLHLVAVPQFGTGAMENWGAIAFQEYLLLLGDRSPVATRMTAVEVICHEIAHQWFGDLVTMRWWNDLWLNESFATFVAAKASDALFPEWRSREEFLADLYARALFWDGMPHTHPVRADVTEPDQIRQIFDAISYGKGAGILQMAEAHIGEEAFRRGVSGYLRAHRLGNADAADLWRAVAAVSDPSVERIFSEWVERPGLPLVTARQEGSTLHLDQQRFTLLEPESSVPWPIPVTVRDGGGRVHRRLFDTASTTIGELPGTPIVNPGRTGFYRVRYLGGLADRVLGEFRTLPPVDRWGLVNDSFAFLLSGAIPLEEHLRYLELLRAETDPFVLRTIEALAVFRYPLVHRVPSWERALREVVVAQSERLGLAPAAAERERVGALRESVQLARVRLDPPFARELAGLYAGLSAVDPNLVRPVLAARALTAGPEEYRELRSRLAETTSAERKIDLAGALGLVDRPEWLREGLALLSDGTLTLGPWARLLGTAVLRNPDLAPVVWSFVEAEAGRLFGLLAGTGTLGPLVELVLPALGIARPQEVRAFVAAREFPDSRRAVQNAMDELELYERVVRRTGGP